MCQNFVKLEIVLEKNLVTLNVENPNNFLPLEKVYIGSECESLVNTLPLSAAREFRIKCLQFYKKSVVEMQKRLPLNTALFEEMKFLNLSIAFSEDNFSLLNLSNYFKDYVDINKIEVEWRNLKLNFHADRRLQEQNIEYLWDTVRGLKEIDDKPAYENLSNLASLVMILPHSNAEAERLFSIVNDIKIKKRNRLGAEVLNSMCVVRSALHDNGSSCVNFEVKTDHLKLHNTNMYSFKNKSDNNNN